MQEHDMMMDYFESLRKEENAKIEYRKKALAFQNNPSEANKQKAFLKYYGKSEELPAETTLYR